MSKTNWKGFERWVAKRLGVERNSKKNLGETAPDVIKKVKDYILLIECKNRSYIKIEEELKKCNKYRKNDYDLVVLCYRKTNKKVVDVYMFVIDFLKLCGIIYKTKKSLLLDKVVIRFSWDSFLYIIKYVK